MNIDRLVRSKRKTIALIVERDGTLTVRAPLHATEAQIYSLVEQKAGWVEAHRARMRESSAAVRKKFADGEQFLYLGQAYPLQVVNRPKALLVLNGRFELSQAALPQAAQVFERWYRREARKVITERVESYARRHDLDYRRIRISGARTRWGSCSAKGGLNFTWRLVMAPLAVIDYVVVHELAHLQVRNHSPAFWRRVAELMPEFREQRKWLKENGRFLTLE